MLNKLRQTIRSYDMLQPGDQVVCAVSGGADSVALLFAMYLLREKLSITVSAAHFNHGLRGKESDRDEDFVRALCDRLDIPLSVGRGNVAAGKKGLEAAARDARYAFLSSLPGKLATAHTANDNAETVLMHLVRGTGLRGLGGITPYNGKILRPMLEVTREEVIAFLEEYNLDYVTDSTNGSDQFLRNRLRNHVIPLLVEENPSFSVNVSEMAQRLRRDDELLQTLSGVEHIPSVTQLRQMPEALRYRIIKNFLESNGVPEPEARHVQSVDGIVFSDKPSACVTLRNGVVISRCYDKIVLQPKGESLQPQTLSCPGEVYIQDGALRIICRPATEFVDTTDRFVVQPAGMLCVRHRIAGDTIRTRGGRKDLKKLFIDRKIPASERLQIPVIADDLGVVAVVGFGASRDRISKATGAVEISFLKEKEEEKGHE